MSLCSEMGALHRGGEGGEDQVGGSMGRNLEIYGEHNEFMAECGEFVVGYMSLELRGH